jgi:3-hydroxybutyryl-CoA dehydrogenase
MDRLETIGVIGAGVMGVGLAQNLAQTGHRVILVDETDERLRAARAEIRQNLRLQGLFRKGEAAARPDEVLARVDGTRELEALAAADFVVENVTEKLAIKRTIYPRIDEICRSECVFAANTSAISITRLASLTRRPDRVLGMHFMNPVPLKDTVEVIRGYHTSEATLATAEALLAQMGKDAIVVEDFPGFVSNRILMLTINEAVFVVQDGVAPAADVDRLFKTCFGHKMGPLETGDLIGLDTILYTLEVLCESYNDDKFRPAPLLRKMVDAGLHGRKSGRGFYDYSASLGEG